MSCRSPVGMLDAVMLTLKDRLDVASSLRVGPTVLAQISSWTSIAIQAASARLGGNLHSGRWLGGHHAGADGKPDGKGIQIVRTGSGTAKKVRYPPQGSAQIVASIEEGVYIRSGAVRLLVVAGHARPVLEFSPHLISLRSLELDSTTVLYAVNALKLSLRRVSLDHEAGAGLLLTILLKVSPGRHGFTRQTVTLWSDELALPGPIPHERPLS